MLLNNIFLFTNIIHLASWIMLDLAHKASNWLTGCFIVSANNEENVACSFTLKTGINAI
jgi:hypothetical protein